MIFFAYVTRMSSKNDFIFLTKEYNNNKGTLLIGDHKNRSSCKRLTILQKINFRRERKEEYFPNIISLILQRGKQSIGKGRFTNHRCYPSKHDYRESFVNAHPTLLIPIKYHKHFFLLPKDKDDR